MSDEKLTEKKEHHQNKEHHEKDEEKVHKVEAILEDDFEDLKDEEAKEDKEIEEKPVKPFNSNLVVAIIAVVLVVSFLAIVFIPKYLAKQEFENNKHNGFQFIKQSDGFWYTVVNKGDQPFSIPFYYHPKELDDIIIEPGLRDKFFKTRDLNGTIYISIDPESESNKVVIAGVEIARITGDKYGLLSVKTKSGFLQEPITATTNTQTPIITCQDASEDTLVVAIIVSTANVVSSQDNCIILQAKSYNETVAVADRLVYHILGIMN